MSRQTGSGDLPRITSCTSSNTRFIRASYPFNVPVTIHQVAVSRCSRRAPVPACNGVTVFRRVEGRAAWWWIGKSSQDEVGTAAYKTVELDEYLQGAATQHRELQREPSDDFVALFSRIRILSGGARSGFTHVETEEEPKEISTLLRVFKHPLAKRADSIMVYEVEPTWQSLDESDVFVLERKDKIWVWQGRNCSPMEKAKAAQAVHDMTIAKHVDVEVLSQSESRSRTVVNRKSFFQPPVWGRSVA
ncbi:hypothetical protein NUW58_g4652 [Xylaria curta]|uniref:Uncharacterized protein n=1 Tax=Xylaria curta TaxID=42375 RepID=A0ACC1P6R3_9PEZI|nr:hypothetical protein NUW58_g4652 [Xylaria curta]